MTDNETNLSRRRAVSGLGAAGLAVAAGPLLAADAATGGSGAATPAAEPLQNPLTKYPRPPFKKQETPWPGLASKMDPLPDHGEKSYKGSGRLKGRKPPIYISANIPGGDEHNTALVGQYSGRLRREA